MNPFLLSPSEGSGLGLWGELSTERRTQNFLICYVLQGTGASSSLLPTHTHTLAPFSTLASPTACRRARKPAGFIERRPSQVFTNLYLPYIWGGGLVVLSGPGAHWRGSRSLWRANRECALEREKEKRVPRSLMLAWKAPLFLWCWAVLNGCVGKYLLHNSLLMPENYPVCLLTTYLGSPAIVILESWHCSVYNCGRECWGYCTLDQQ